MRASTTFSLSQDRGRQLREIARNRNTTVADVIGGWIAREFDERGTPSQHDPCETAFESDRGEVSVRIDFFGDEHRLKMTPAETASLASSFRAVINKETSAVLNLDAQDATVMRKGAGLWFSIGAYGRQVTMDVAREIASELEAAASEAPHV